MTSSQSARSSCLACIHCRSRGPPSPPGFGATLVTWAGPRRALCWRSYLSARRTFLTGARPPREASEQDDPRGVQSYSMSLVHAAVRLPRVARGSQTSPRSVARAVAARAGPLCARAHAPRLRRWVAGQLTRRGVVMTAARDDISSTADAVVLELPRSRTPGTCKLSARPSLADNAVRKRWSSTWPPQPQSTTRVREHLEA
jgi:hypothetical protein